MIIIDSLSTNLYLTRMRAIIMYTLMAGKRPSLKSYHAYPWMNVLIAILQGLKISNREPCFSSMVGANGSKTAFGNSFLFILEIFFNISIAFSDSPDILSHLMDSGINLNK